MKGFFHKKDTHTQNDHIAEEYLELTERLAAIRSNFDFAADDDTIDALIFEENAAVARLSALLRRAKASGARLESFEVKKSEKNKKI